MTAGLPASLSALADQRVRSSGDRPFLTYYDDATGERTELSYATFDNWACKTANLLLEEFGAGGGTDVAVDLGSHWTTATAVFGCWRAGARVVLAGGEGSVAIRDDTGVPTVGGLDYRREVLAYADEVGDAGAGLDDGALLVAGRVALTQRNVLAAADAIAAWGVGADTRLLVARSPRTVDGLVLGLLGTFLAGGSVVALRALDPATMWRRVREERVTAALVSAQALDALTAPDGDHGLGHLLCPAGAGLDAMRAAERRLGIPVAVGHGVVEATCASSLVPADAGPDVRAWLARTAAPTVGVATSRAEIAIADGEIRIRGDVVTPDAGDWLHTGDEGFIETGPDGRDYVFLTA